jgi:ADP-ribose pyrophosphatase
MSPVCVGQAASSRTPSPRVGVGVLILDDNARVLLTLRRRPPEAGAWSILGGRLELYERIVDCAVRESMEEAGIEITIRQLLCVTDHIVLDEHEHWVAPAFLAHIVGGEPINREPDKTVELRWFPLRATPANLTITARAAIDAVLRQHLVT